MRRGQKPSKSKAQNKRSAPRPQNVGARVRQLENRLAEALDQQTATSEILEVISRSPSEVQTVSDMIAESAARLCDAIDVTIFQIDSDVLRVVVHKGPIPSASVGQTRPLVRETPTGRAVLDRRTIHVADVQAEIDEYPEGGVRARRLGYRTILAAPLLHVGEAIGAIVIRRTDVRPFTDRQVDLLHTFANQAVIAIENVRLFTELEARNRDLTESLEQQTATSEILGVISRSLTDTQPVFDAIAANAARLCSANDAQVLRVEGEVLRLVAAFGAPSMPSVRRLTRGHLVGRAVIDRTTIHVRDLAQALAEYPETTAARYGVQSALAVPLLREGVALGVIRISRTEIQPFTDRQIALLQTFADQAVIAIENVRLFKELEARNGELTTALEQQTATSEILRVISSSPNDVQPVFDSIVRNAVTLCRALYGMVWRYDGELAQLVGQYNLPSDEQDELRRVFPQPLANLAFHEAIRTGVMRNVADIEAASEVPAATRERWRRRGVRSVLVAPMRRGAEVIGAIGVSHHEIGAFSPSREDLLKTFADQAVIAIENVRLFNETKEALERQTATAEVLRVISRSHADPRPVFEAIAENAMRLFRAWAVQVYRLESQWLHLQAARGGRQGMALPEWAVEQEVSRASYRGRSILDRAIVHVRDVLSDAGGTARAREWARADGWRSVINAPMLRDSAPIGLITVYRLEPGGFLPAEVELLKTFADQAVIAVENARLLAELHARTDELQRSVGQLTALGEVGRAVSSTLDLETVLTTIVSRAVQLTGMDGGVVFEYDEAAEEFVHRAAAETGGVLAQARRGVRYRKGEGALGRTALTLEPVEVADIMVPGAYESRVRENLIESGVRAILAVPMVREGQVIGCLGVTRNRPGAFPAETIELLRTFATQSALAIQNARLFRELAEKSRELEAASQHKSEFLANMSHELRTPLNAIIGFSEVLSEKMFGDLNEKQEEYLKDIYASGTHLLSLINDILDLSKIEAGRMELELTDFDLPTAIENALMLVRERAGRRSISLQTSIDNRLGAMHADERKVRQVVLNLLSNAIKFTPEGGRIEIAAVPKDGFAEISVSDTGVGIAPEDQEAVFEEFRQVGTAAKKVEGTGLGLALCRKFAELHGGRIWVKSELGVGSTFTFSLPLHRA
jgi:signal transduction histidine kinase